MTNKINNPLSLNNVETMSFFYDMGNGQDDITNDVKEGNVFQYHIDKDELMFEEVKKLFRDFEGNLQLKEPCFAIVTALT